MLPSEVADDLTTNAPPKIKSFQIYNSHPVEQLTDAPKNGGFWPVTLSLSSNSILVLPEEYIWMFGTECMRSLRHCRGCNFVSWNEKQTALSSLKIRTTLLLKMAQPCSPKNVRAWNEFEKRVRARSIQDSKRRHRVVSHVDPPLNIEKGSR